MNLGPHADFIVAAYAVTIFVVAALVAWIALDYSALQRILGDLEERGINRRSLQYIRDHSNYLFPQHSVDDDRVEDGLEVKARVADDFEDFGAGRLLLQRLL